MGARGLERTAAFIPELYLKSARLATGAVSWLALCQTRNEAPLSSNLVVEAFSFCFEDAKNVYFAHQ